MVIPNQNSANLLVSPCFARVWFQSPVFCPMSPVLPRFCLKMPVFCCCLFCRFFLPVMPRFCLKMPVLCPLLPGLPEFVRFCPNSPEFVHFCLSCAVRRPLIRMNLHGLHELSIHSVHHSWSRMRRRWRIIPQGHPDPVQGHPEPHLVLHLSVTVPNSKSFYVASTTSLTSYPLSQTR